jgi:hypothetical protein
MGKSLAAMACVGALAPAGMAGEDRGAPASIVLPAGWLALRALADRRLAAACLAGMV